MNCGPNHRFMVRTNNGVLLVHNCGYGTGPNKLAYTLLRDKAILDPDRDKHCAKARELHQLYRANNPHIVNFWHTCQKIIEHMVQGGTGWFGGPNNTLFQYGTFTVCGKEMVPSIILPSGYVLRYPNLRMEINDKGKAEFFYDRPLGKNIIKTRIYGGAMTENLTQALAFQILMCQANDMDSVGIKLSCNIHDSFATIVPEADAQGTAQLMVSLMRREPKWCEGLPLDAEAEIGDDFTVV